MNIEKYKRLYGDQSKITRNKPFYRLFQVLVGVCLIVSAISSYSFYLGLFNDFYYNTALAAICTVSASTLIGFFTNHALIKWFSNEGGFDFTTIVATVLIGANFYADLEGVKVIGEQVHDEVTWNKKSYDNSQLAVIQSFEQDLNTYKQQIKDNSNWKNYAYSDNKTISKKGWQMYNIWKKASKKVDEIERNKAKTIEKQNIQREKEFSYFQSEYKKREGKVSKTTDTLKGVASICTGLVVLMLYFIHDYQKEYVTTCYTKGLNVQTPLQNKNSEQYPPDILALNKEDKDSIGFYVSSLQESYPIATALLASGYSIRSARKEANLRGEKVSHHQTHEIQKQIKSNGNKRNSSQN